MANPKTANTWFGLFLRVVIMAAALPLCTWGGFGLWGFFSSAKTSDSPTSSGTRVFLEKKPKNGEPHENPLLEGIKENNLIEYQESNSRISEIEDLITRSDGVSRLIEARFDVMRSSGVGQLEIESHPDYEVLEREHRFRETATAEIDRLLLILSIIILKSD